MATMESTVDSSGELFDFLCSPCNKADKYTEAVKHCVDCQEYICGSCVKSHNSFSVLAGHTLVGRSKFGKTSRTDHEDLPSVPTERCKVHSLKLVDMYCADHDSVGCHVCFTINHKTCQDIHYIPEYVETTKQTERVRTINDKMDNTISDMDTLMKKNIYIEDIMKTKATCMGEVNALRKEINEALDRLEQASIAEIDTKFGKLEQYLQEDLKKIQNTLDKVTKYKAEIESSQRNPSQQFVNMKISENIKSEMKKAESQLTGELLCSLSFERNSEILHFLQNLETLAKTALPVNHGLYEVQSKQSYNVRLNDHGSNCNIWSSCLLDSGDILLADFNIKNIKLVDCDSYKVKSSLKMSDRHQSVCRISSVEAAVSLGNKTVQFVSTKNGLTPKRSLSFDHGCRGIAAMDDQLVICFSTKVYIYTMNGERLKAIEKDSTGSNIFSRIREICLSDNGKSIHMADETKGLVTIDKYGNVIWKYSGKEFQSAWGVCTDGNGNVFMSDGASTIIQLGPNGSFIGEVVSKAHGLKGPSAVNFDRKKYKLIVAELGQNELHTFHVQ